MQITVESAFTRTGWYFRRVSQCEVRPTQWRPSRTRQALRAWYLPGSAPEKRGRRHYRQQRRRERCGTMRTNRQQGALNHHRWAWHNKLLFFSYNRAPSVGLDHFWSEPGQEVRNAQLLHPKHNRHFSSSIWIKQDHKQSLIWGTKLFFVCRSEEFRSRLSRYVHPVSDVKRLFYGSRRDSAHLSGITSSADWRITKFVN